MLNSQTHRRWLSYGKCCAVWLVFAACLLVPLTLWARAGGGQGYSGGGSGGSGGSGDGGDIAYLVYLLIRLCIEYPWIGLPLVCLIALFFFWASLQTNEAYKGNVIRRAVSQTSNERGRQALAELQAEDPAFDEAAFCNRVRQAFLQVQQAWTGQDMTPAAAFVSDGVFERFSLQFAEQRDFGYRNQLDNLQVREVGLREIDHDQAFQILTVGIRAQGDDYRVSLADGKRLAKGDTSEEFVEFWTFLRRRDQQTTGRPGLIEGRCPNCGANVQINQLAQCPACKSQLRSGDHDWTLTEITQESAWHDVEAGRAVGVDQYRTERDPEFSIPHLEDRASVIFWRRAMADRLGSVEPLMKMALPEFCDQYRQQLQVTVQGRVYPGECAVGAVMLLGVLPGDSFDRAIVQVRWAAQRLAARENEPPRPLGEVSLKRSLFVLTRRKGVKSALGHALASAHCPQCGAPEKNLTASAC